MSSSGQTHRHVPCCVKTGGWGGGGGTEGSGMHRSHSKVMPDTQAARGCPLAGVGSRQLVLL